MNEHRHDMHSLGQGCMLIAGVDEAGRGAGAAEVYVGAVILNPEHCIEGLADSKKLTKQRREYLSDEIKHHALCWCIATASVEEVENLNVLQATLLAMRRAVQGLSVRPDRVLVDGNHTPKIKLPVDAVVRGDDSIPAISAASILAKVARDQAMLAYHQRYPHYRFDLHKGYLTKLHKETLSTYGPCPIHRRTYAPVRLLLGADAGTGQKLF